MHDPDGGVEAQGYAIGAGGCALGALDLSEVSVAEDVVGEVEVGMVEDVVGGGADAEIEFFFKGKSFEEAHVEVDVVGATELIASLIGEGSVAGEGGVGGIDEGIGIEARGGAEIGSAVGGDTSLPAGGRGSAGDLLGDDRTATLGDRGAGMAVNHSKRQAAANLHFAGPLAAAEESGEPFAFQMRGRSDDVVSVEEIADVVVGVAVVVGAESAGIRLVKKRVVADRKEAAVGDFIEGVRVGVIDGRGTNCGIAREGRR